MSTDSNAKPEGTPPKKSDRKVLIRGHISFRFDENEFKFERVPLSLTGSTRLSWGILSPKKHFGKQVKIKIQIRELGGTAIEAPAYITRESVREGRDYMGLKFQLSPIQQEQIRMVISQHGYLPDEYERKYPRIPFHEKVGVFPNFISGKLAPLTLKNEKLVGIALPEAPETILYSIDNLSPNGFLIQTQNQLSLGLSSNDILNLKLEPRGDFRIPIRMDVQIRRTVDDIDLNSRNVIRSFGLKIVKIEDDQRMFYMKLLQDILEDLQKVK